MSGALNMGAFAAAASKSAFTAPTPPPTATTTTQPLSMSNFEQVAAQSAGAPTTPIPGAPAQAQSALQAGAAGLAQGANSLVNLPFQAANWVANNVVNPPAPVVGQKIGVPGTRGWKIATQKDVDDYKPNPKAEALQSAITGATAGPQALQDVSAKALASPAGQYVNVQPKGVAQNAAFGAGSMLPFALAQAVPGAGQAEDVGLLGKIGSAAKNAGSLLGLGAASGVGSEAGAAMAPAGYKGIGSFVGSLLGGGLYAGAETAGSQLVKGAASGLVESAPVTAGLQARSAANILRANAQNPDVENQVSDILSRRTIQTPSGEMPIGPKGELVPGSEPTTAQLAGDRGLANLQTARSNPQLAGPFQARKIEQEAARQSAVADIHPADADPSAPAQFIKAALDTTNSDYDVGIAQARGDYENAAQHITNAAPPSMAGEAGRSILENEIDARKAASGSIFKYLEEQNPVMDVSPVGAAAEKNMASLAAKGQVPHPAEADFYQRAQEMAQNPIHYMYGQGFREDLGAAIRGAAPGSGNQYAIGDAARARLINLRSAYDNATATASERALSAAPAATAGEAPVAQQNFQAARDAWLNDKYGSNAIPQTSNAGRVGNVRAGAGANGPARQASVRAASGQGSQDGTRLGSLGTDNSGVEGKASTPIVPWSKDHENVYRQGISGVAERHALVDKTEVGKVLKKNGSAYALPNATVGSALLPGGNKARQAAENYLAFTRNEPEAIQAYKDMMSRDLADSAITNGTLDIGKHARWMKRNEGAFEAIPDLRADFQAPADAARTVQANIQQKADAQKAFEQSAAAHYLRTDDPVAAVNRVLSGPNAISNARELLGAVSGSPAAVNGVKANVASWVRKNVLSEFSNGETVGAAIKAAMLRKTLESKLPALRLLLGDDSVNLMQRTLHDYERNDITGYRRVGGSGSPTSMNDAQSNAVNSGDAHSVAGNLINAAQQPLFALLALKAHAFTGGATSLIARVLAKSALAKRDEIIDDALLNPAFFAHLLKKYPKTAAGESQFHKKTAALLGSAMMRSPQGAQQ